LAVLTLALAATPTPERTFELVLSPQFSVEVGARDVLSFQRLLFLYDDVWNTAFAFDESTPGTKTLGVFGRLAKLVLVDGALTSFFLTIQHEVFGHGARAREEGQAPRFSLSVPLPYMLVLDPMTQFSGLAFVDRTGFADRDLPITLGGMESETFMTHLLAVRALSRGGSLHFSEQLTYLVGRASYGRRLVERDVLGSRTDGSDPDTYVQQLMNRFNLFGPEEQLSVSQRLRVAWATQFLDPVWWLCAKQLFVDYLWRGERWARLPRVQIDQVGLLPALRFNFTPFGAEHILSVIVMHPRFTLDVSARAVSSGLATSLGGGARLFGFKPVSWLELGGSLDVWLQPELLHDVRNAYDGRQRPGVSGMVEAHWRPLPRVGLVAQLGYKTNGYVIAQPTRAGFFGFAGVSFTLDPPVATSGPPAANH
jgi:hypothetical protein